MIKKTGVIGKVGTMGVVAWFDSHGIYFAPEEEEMRGEEGVYFVVAIQARLCLCGEWGWRIRDDGW